MNYWTWFFRGVRDRPGYRRFLDRWLVLHIFTGIFLSVVLPISLSEAAERLLLPLAGILIVLCFAWGGNAQALLQTREIERFAEHRPGGVVEYGYAYLTAMLVMLFGIVLWGLAAVGIFERLFSGIANSVPYRAAGAVLFFWASLGLRECWHVVLGAQYLLEIRHQVAEMDRRNELAAKAPKTTEDDSTGT